MDKRAKEEMREILAGFGNNHNLIEETMDSLIDIFNSYRRRTAALERQRREIEAELREQEND